MNKRTIFVSYLREHRSRQGQSEAVLERQREAVLRHLDGRELLAEFTEIESRKGQRTLATRPKLHEALAFAKAKDAVLVIAKLGRLASEASFINELMAHRIAIEFADKPGLNIHYIQNFAIVAEQEAAETRRRIREGLGAAKARGMTLGAHGKVLAAQNKAAALEGLAPVAERLKAMRDAGFSIRTIADSLNAEAISSPGGGRWHASSVHKALKRLG